MKPYRSHEEYLLKELKDPLRAIAYLNAALEDGDERVFLLALRQVMEAQGGLSRFARRTKLNRVSLYKMLSQKGNPEWGSLLALLRALNIRFQVMQNKKVPGQKRAA